MNAELLQFQQRAYQIATEFAQAQSDYWAIHTPYGRSAQVQAAARECLKVGERYGDALKALLQHLETLGGEGKWRQEINRTQRLISSLKGEVEFFSIT